MAYYSYKDLCYQIPSHIEQQFEDEHGREPDGDPNYNGDYWTLAAMWVSELETENAKLAADLKRAQTELSNTENQLNEADAMVQGLQAIIDEQGR